MCIFTIFPSHIPSGVKCPFCFSSVCFFCTINRGSHIWHHIFCPVQFCRWAARVAVVVLCGFNWCADMVFVCGSLDAFCECGSLKILLFCFLSMFSFFSLFVFFSPDLLFSLLYGPSLVLAVCECALYVCLLFLFVFVLSDHTGFWLPIVCVLRIFRCP